MKVLIPIIILLLAGTITTALLIFQPTVEAVLPERPVTNVETITVQAEAVRVTVRSQGVVLPWTETNLSTEVSGRVIELGENFQVGAHFAKGETLLRIDPADYAAAVAGRRAELASARLVLEQEVALAEQAREDWQRMGASTVPSPLTLRDPQVARAQAQVAAAEAALAQAERRLENTRVQAPYDGRVLRRMADIGQNVTANPAAPIAQIYATARAVLRLPVTLQDAAFLDPAASPPQVARLYQSKKDGGKATWTGRLVRMEGTIDPGTRLLHAVVELDTPLAAAPNEARQAPPLRRGQFVAAEIEGRQLEGVYRLPRYALRDSDTTYVVSAAGTLGARQVEVIHTDETHVIIGAGLQPGEQVAVSPIAYFVENMPVNVISRP